AMLAQFAEDNPGTYGLAFADLSGFRFKRVAAFQADKQFKAAGAEGLYIAYAVLMERHSGWLRPVDKISGDKNVEECLKDMIEKGDEGCRDGFYRKFGHAKTTARGKELGLTGTTFAGKDTVTTAGDLQKVMVGLYENQVARNAG